MEAIQRLRESINEQLDKLVEQIESQKGAFALHGDRISWAEDEAEEEEKEADATTNNESRRVSAKGSPSRVSFGGTSSIGK